MTRPARRRRGEHRARGLARARGVAEGEQGASAQELRLEALVGEGREAGEGLGGLPGPEQAVRLVAQAHLGDGVLRVDAADLREVASLSCAGLRHHVAEGFELGARLGAGDEVRRERRVAGELRLDERVELPAQRRLGLGEVPLLTRIRRHVVELGARRPQILVALRAHAEERAPAEVEARREGLEVGDPRRLRLAGEEGNEARAARPGERRRTGESQERGRDVRETHQRRHRLPGGNARTGEDQGHVLGGVVERVGVGGLAVLAEALAVVARRRDEGAFAGEARREALEQAAELGVGEGDLAAVAIAREVRGVGLGGPVAGVGIVEVDPEEEARRRIGEPGERGVHHPVCAPLGDARAAAPAAPEAERVVVDVEAPRETEATVEDERGDEGRGREALALERLGEGRDAGGEDVHGVVTDAVLRRVHARQQGRVGGQREGRRREGALEARALRGEGVEPGRRAGDAPVAAEGVGAQRVDRDEHHALRAFAARAARGAEQREPEGRRAQRPGVGCPAPPRKAAAAPREEPGAAAPRPGAIAQAAGPASKVRPSGAKMRERCQPRRSRKQRSEVSSTPSP